VAARRFFAAPVVIHWSSVPLYQPGSLASPPYTNYITPLLAAYLYGLRTESPVAPVSYYVQAYHSLFGSHKTFNKYREEKQNNKDQSITAFSTHSQTQAYMGGLKTRDWKTRDHEKYGGEKRRTGERRTKFLGWKTQDHRLWNAKWISIKTKGTLYDMYILLQI